VADAPDAEDPPQGAASSRWRGPRHRTVRKTFRVSAVWQPPRGGAPDGQDGERGPRAAGTALTDEELVYGLITARGVFEGRALDVTHEIGSAETREVREGVESIALEDVRPGGSVLAQLAFVVQVKGSAVAVVAGLAPAVMAAAAEALESVYRQPVAVSAVREHGGADTTATAAPKSGWDKVAPILGAIGTGVGVIGFVTFIGGVTVYARLRAAGFPAAPALGIFPSQDLIVIGAQTLVPEVLWALAAVIALGVLYAVIRGSQHITVEEKATLLAGYRKYDPRRLLVRGRKRLSDEEAALLAGHATRFVVIGMSCFVGVALFGSILPFLHVLDGTHQLYALGLIGVAAFLAAAVVSVTRRFVYLAMTTFVLVGVILSFTAYWREGQTNAVRGAAIVRDNKKPVAGLFVAEGSGRVYIARVSLVDEDACKKAGGGVDGCQIIDHRSRLVGIAKDQVSDVALGDPKPPWRALEQARHLARELCDLQVERPAVGC
jgi:hypothetical protein